MRQTLRLSPGRPAAGRSVRSLHYWVPSAECSSSRGTPTGSPQTGWRVGRTHSLGPVGSGGVGFPAGVAPLLAFVEASTTLGTRAVWTEASGDTEAAREAVVWVCGWDGWLPLARGEGDRVRLQRSASVPPHGLRAGARASAHSELRRPVLRCPLTAASLSSTECSDFSPPVTVILLIFLCLEGLLFFTFTAVMFGTQIHSICNDETVRFLFHCARLDSA